MTLSAFLAAYRALLLANMPWAQQDPDKLDRYMGNVRATLTTNTATWSHTGPLMKAAWRQIGGSGTPSLRVLRALRRD